MNFFIEIICRWALPIPETFERQGRFNGQASLLDTGRQRSQEPLRVVRGRFFKNGYGANIALALSGQRMNPGDFTYQFLNPSSGFGAQTGSQFLTQLGDCRLPELSDPLGGGFAPGVFVRIETGDKFCLRLSRPPAESV